MVQRWLRSWLTAGREISPPQDDSLGAIWADGAVLGPEEKIENIHGERERIRKCRRYATRL